jgi:ABC-type nitrate/sulfonate/bicarbonate transport system ATPase subunit
MSDNVLSLDGVGHAFGPAAVLAGVTLDVGRHEFVAVVGPSGCGKTTLLHLLAGALRPTTGVVRRHGRVRMVYQEGGLFPWLTAAQNVALGLRHLRDEAERRGQVAAMLELVGLEGYGAHYPHQLSGGMRQRVELARALAGDTDILLMDEPFSSLDYLTRLQLRAELGRLLRRRPCTVVFVTHHLEEAVQLADRVLVLGDRPARVRAAVTPGRPRPRPLACPEVAAAVRRLEAEFGLADELLEVV